MKSNRPIVFIIPLLTAIISMSLFFAAIANGWFGTPQGVDEDFCEAAHSGLIKHPFNTWSNVAFIISGLLIAWQLSRVSYCNNRNTLTCNWFYAAFFSSVVVLLCPSSMAMHATDTNAGRFFDLFSMYLVVSFTLAYSVERYFRLRPVHFVLIFLAVLTSCVWFYYQPYHIPILGTTGASVFAFYLLLTTVVEVLNTYVRHLNHDSRWLFASLMAFMLAFVIWNLTKTGTSFCDPQSLIQGHGLWQVLSAVSLYFLFKFYLSEKVEGI